MLRLLRSMTGLYKQFSAFYMLAWRVVPRPAATLRLGGLTTTRRPLQSSIPRCQFQPRPHNLWGKICFRKDGQPRSRLVGVAFGSLILLNVLTLFTTSNFVEDSEIALLLLAGVIYTQQVDMGFDKVDLDNSIATLLYFKTLYQAFSRAPPDEVDELFKDLTRLMNLGGSGDAEGEAHRIMRSAAEQIHTVFQNLNQDSTSNTANYVLQVMREAVESLIELAEDDEDDESETKYTFQLIRNHSKKDASSVLKDYESLG